MKNIRQGSIIKGSNWPEPIEVKFIEETGEYIHIVGLLFGDDYYLYAVMKELPQPIRLIRYHKPLTALK